MITPIPECHDIFGVGQDLGRSDSERSPAAVNQAMAIATSGIQVGRPLLSCEKSQLIALCQRSDVKWFEDPTNADRMLTVRNTIRYLQKTQDLPVALRTARLNSLVREVSEKRDREQNMAMNIFNSMPVNLGLRLGVAQFSLERTVLFAIGAAPGIVKSYLLREMLMLVSPTATIKLDQLNSAVKTVFPSNEVVDGFASPGGTSNLGQVAGVQIFRVAASEPGIAPALILRRAAPRAVERQTLDVHLWPFPPDSHQSQSNTQMWQLWDHRYWIRVRPPKSSKERNTQIWVRMVDSDMLSELRKQLPLGARATLAQALRHAPGVVRFTMPAIFMTQNVISAGSSSVTEKLVVLPSVNWNAPGWVGEPAKSDSSSWRWDIKYKHVDMSSEHHKIGEDRMR